MYEDSENILSIFCLVYISLCTLCLVFRKNTFPIEKRQHVQIFFHVHVTYLLYFLISMNITSCFVNYWTSVLIFPFHFFPLCARGFHLYYLNCLENEKDKIKSRHLHKSILSYYDYVLGIMIIPIIIIGIIVWIKRGYGVGDECNLSVERTDLFIVFGTIYCILSSMLCVMIHKINDLSKVKMELTSCYVLSYIILFINLIASDSVILHYTLLIYFILHSTLSITLPYIASFNCGPYAISPKISPRKLSRYALTFRLLINTDEGIEAFTKHLKREFAVENINFYKAVLRFESNDTYDLALNIYKTYISVEALSQINLPNSIRKQIEEMILSKTINTDMFEDAKKEIVSLMEKDSFQRFKKTSICRAYLRDNTSFYV